MSLPHTFHLPAYRKALDIFKLSRALAAYFSHDKHVLHMSLSAKPQDRFAGLLITESLQLAPGIASIASTSCPNSRLKRIKRVKQTARRLKAHCRKLEFSGVKDIEFLNLLKKELHQFDHMVADWVQHFQR